jgi:mannose-6-phosphate isomerase-like protein (cupin superfamily)
VKIFRPWGSFEVLTSKSNYQIKQINVDVNQRLSLQSHEFRSEHWFILSGEAEVEKDGDIYSLKFPDSIFIPARVKHRVRALGHTPLSFIEVQSGTSFAEDDIQRYEDDYGRAN